MQGKCDAVSPLTFRIFEINRIWPKKIRAKYFSDQRFTSDFTHVLDRKSVV
jgi:hypothetical protein